MKHRLNWWQMTEPEQVHRLSAADVQESVARLGLSPSPEQVESLLSHTIAVLDRNRFLNLTRITEPDEVLRLHIVDSLTALSALADAPRGRVADIGSGAGYPGIPLAIMSGRQFTLIESVKKKAAFLAEYCEAREPGIEILPLRAEEVAENRPSAFAAVTARALSSLPSLVELAAPLLEKHGLLIALKGVGDETEIAAGDAAGRICGMRRRAGVGLVLPGGDESRNIVVYEAVAKPRIRLPRRPGMAQRHPLG